MNFLRSLFGEKPDPLLDRAVTLVQAAQVNAVGMFTPLLDRFPILRQVDTEHWEFILTVAGVFMAATRLNNLRLGDVREEKLMEVVADRLSVWKPDGIRAFEDCKGLFEVEFDRLNAAEHDSRFAASDAVGKWIVWNVLGHPPETDNECMLVRSAGALATHAFFDWWDSEPHSDSGGHPAWTPSRRQDIMRQLTVDELIETLRIWKEEGGGLCVLNTARQFAFGAANIEEVNDSRVAIRLEGNVKRLELAPETEISEASFAPSDVVTAWHSTTLEQPADGLVARHFDEMLQLVIRGAIVGVALYRATKFKKR